MESTRRALGAIRGAATGALAAGLLAACQPAANVGAPLDAPRVSGAAPATSDAAEPLADTSWRLVEFLSMDDAIGALRPADPADYTLRLARDGRASLRLDCNRATGTWSAEPAADPRSGHFAFGPLATTLAACPEPGLGERIAADAAYVRSYLLRGSRLHLSLLADGGIYTWQRESPVALEARPDARIEAALLAASPDYTREIVSIDGREARYVYGRVDLDGDGQSEVLALLLGSIFCGTGGCNLVLLTGAGEGYRVVDTFPLSRLPILVADERTAGWSDLIRPESGGGAPRSYVRHVFDGSHYVETERLPGDVTPEGTWLLTGDYAYATGHPLAPGD